MLNILMDKIKVPKNMIDDAKLLDMYYIPTRYPNGFPSGKPADYFTERHAREAINAADRIIRFCEGYMDK